MPSLPTNYNLDVSNLKGKSLDSPEFKELIIRLENAFQQIASNLNTKNSGEFSLQEVSSTQRWFFNPALTPYTAQQPVPRVPQRTVINFGTLPNAGTTSIAHNIAINASTQPNITFTNIYGAANDIAAPLYIPLPFSTPAALNQQISLTVNATNVNITTGTNRNNITV